MRKLRPFEVAILRDLADAGGYQYGFKSGALMWLPPAVWPSWAWMCNCMSRVNNSLNLVSANPTAHYGQTGDATMTSSPQTRALIELDGHASDMQTLQSVAPTCNCAIEPGPDQKLGWLYSPKFDGVATPQEAQQEATRILVLLNGLARLKNPKHRNADLGDVLFRDGQLHYFRPPQSRPRRETIWISQPPGVALPVIEVDARLARIAADPKLAEIAEVFGEEIKWQRLRVAFEKVTNLVGKSRKDYAALWKHSYATRDEVDRFKANVEDPRLSGHEAVHGVPDGPLKGTTMTEKEGHDFVVGLLYTYLVKHPVK